MHHVAGEDCYLIKVRLPDNQALALFMREKVSVIPEVTSTRTIIALETIKETSKIYLPGLENEDNKNSAKL